MVTWAASAVLRRALCALPFNHLCAPDDGESVCFELLELSKAAAGVSVSYALSAAVRRPEGMSSRTPAVGPE